MLGVMPFGEFTGGGGLYLGMIALGSTYLPISIGPGVTDKIMAHLLGRVSLNGRSIPIDPLLRAWGDSWIAAARLHDPEMLLLDEPFNHLDIPSQEILQQVLAEYQGTILLVSHDRYLIDALATQIWEIDEEERSLTVFQGTYSQYQAEKEAAREAERARADALQGKSGPARTKPEGRPSAEERRRRARLKEVEAQITNLEGKLDRLSRQLENPPAEPAKVQGLGEEYVRVQGELELLMKEWESLHD